MGELQSGENAAVEVRELYCSFCGKSRESVRKLITGPSCQMCDECVNLSFDIINAECEVVFGATTLESIALLVKANKIAATEDTARLSRAIVQGDIHEIVRVTEEKLHRSMARLSRFVNPVAPDPREATVRLLAMCLITVMQCATSSGISTRELSTFIRTWALKQAVEH